jgi:hypothetical protein
MKRYHFIIETVLFAITIILLPGALIKENEGALILLMFWWAAFGILQVLHSLLIGARYWPEVMAARKWFIRYWCGVAINFLVLGAVMAVEKYMDKDVHNATYILYVLTLIVFPAMLAVYLWYITWRFRQKEINPE